MSLYVGVPCGITVQAVLDGALGALGVGPGVHAPYDPKVCAFFREELEKEGMGMVERWL